MALQQFTATVSAPGFYELVTIHADDLDAANRRAKELETAPYAGWPPVGCCKRTITVRPATLPSCPVLDLNGAVLRHAAE